MSEAFDSPRMAAFHRQAQSDPIAAVADLRRDLAAAAGPLIESIEDAEHVLVTFCWLGPVDGVVSVRCQLVPSDSAFPVHPLERVEGTDVWFLTAKAKRDVRVTYQYTFDDPFRDLDSRALIEDFDELIRRELESMDRCFADPMNPDRLLPITAAEAGIDLDRAHWESVLALDKESTEGPAENTKPGKSEGLHLTSAVLANDRDVTVWTPDAVDGARDALTLLVILDGNWWMRVAHLERVLADLTSAQRLRPVAAAFVHNPTMTSRLVEMACNSDLTRMLCDELLPTLRNRFAVADDPHRVAILGASYGGLAAAFTAFERPDCFGHAISFSGSFWWGLADPSSQYRLGYDGEGEWLTRQVAAANKKAVRFWLEVGSLEGGSEVFATGVNMIASNRHFRTVLKAKDYVVHYREPSAGHDFANWRASVSAALEWFAGTTGSSTS